MTLHGYTRGSAACVQASCFEINSR